MLMGEENGGSVVSVMWNKDVGGKVTKRLCVCGGGQEREREVREGVGGDEGSETYKKKGK